MSLTPADGRDLWTITPCHDKSDATGLRCDAATPLCCRCLPPWCAYHGLALCRLATLRLASCREAPAPPLCAGAVKCLSPDLSAQWHALSCSPARAPTPRPSPPLCIEPRRLARA